MSVHPTPIFTSLLGDVFYRADDGFWWLDTLEGTLTRAWRSAEELNAALSSEDGQDRYLTGALAMAAERSGPPGTAISRVTIPYAPAK